MARLKAQIDGRWITSDNAQNLVDKALKSQAVKGSGFTVKDYAVRYMRLYKENNSIANNTLIGYRGYLQNHLYPAIGYRDISEITVDIIQDYINSKSTEYTQKTIKEHITLMAEIFDGAIEDGLIAKNPFRSKRLKIFGKESKRIEAYTEDQFRQFEKEVLPKLTGSDQLFAALSMYTGMRRGEICALRWEDIDFANKRIAVFKAVAWPAQNQGIVKRPKSCNGERRPIILPQLYFILSRYQDKKGYLIQGRKANEDKPITREGIKRLYERIANCVCESGIDFDIRSLNRRGRHTMATFMNNAALDEKTIESQLGHHDIKFTRAQYMNAQAKQEERSMERLAAYIAQI